MVTLEEILRQGETWCSLATLLEKSRSELDNLLCWAEQILLVGAGTSEYVGIALAPYLSRHSDKIVLRCGTTDLVTSPNSYCDSTKRTLMVSFARSGDSPESVGAIRAVNGVSQQVQHLVITCNEYGEINRLSQQGGIYHVLLLPQIVNDRGFAMTNSFTSMYYTALLALSDNFAEVACAITACAERTNRFFSEQSDTLCRWIEKFDFERIIYLGSESFKGLAQEASLKILELTSGAISTLYDSPMGFRHGPKSFLRGKALTVLLLSDDPYVRLYELDLLRELSAGRKDDKLLVLCGLPCAEAEALADYVLCLGHEEVYDSALFVPEFAAVVQRIALTKSVALGVDPDNPNPSGAVNRVVKGVILYQN